MTSVTGKYNLSAPVLSDGQQTDLQFDSSGNLKVNVAVGGSSGGTVAIDQTTPGTTNGVVPAGNVAAGATDSGNPIKVGGVYNSSPVILTSGQRGNLQMDSVGSVRALPACNASYVMTDGYAGQNPTGLPDNNNTPRPLGVTAFVYNGSTYNWQRGDSNGTYVVSKPVTSGGLSISRLIGATNGVVKASAGQLYTGTLTNTNAAIRYLQVYNKATAGTLSTDTPVLTVALPPNQTVMIDFSALGGAFATGISWQFTTDDVAIPTTAGASTDIHGFVTYK